MIWRLDNRRRLLLFLLAAAALGLQVLLEATRAPVRQRDYALKLAAARQAAAAFDAVRRHRLLDGAVIDLINDPAGTGLIGPEFSAITNARGDLDAKLTSLNPNFAAVIVEYCRRANLRAGDPVAVALSGSFPALNIGVYAALETLELQPVVTTSIGASMWGANDPAFTWLDMESLFIAEGIFRTRSAAASFGGGDDTGRGLSPEGRRLVAAAAARNGVPMFATSTLDDAITQRMIFYEEAVRGRPYRLYVNVGGGLASLGDDLNKFLVPRGLFFDVGVKNFPRKGAMILMAERGVPVVHLLNVTELARDHGLPVSPDYLPAPGAGDIFIKESYRLLPAIVILVLYCLACLAALAPGVRAAAGRLYGGLGRGQPQAPCSTEAP